MNKIISTHLNLPNLDLSVRALFTGYLFAIGVGLIMSGAQVLLTHGMADGQFGLSVNDIVYSYHGNRGNSKLESKLNGSMKDKAPREVKTELIKWARNGAPEEQWEPKIKPLLQDHCIKCHSTIPSIPNFNDFTQVKDAAKTDQGASIDSLTRVSHIHLFGIAFIFFFVGYIFSFSVGIPKWLKSLAIITPFMFLVTDVFSWWLTKFYPAFAWVTIIGGIGYTIASTFMWITSLYQMWILPKHKEKYISNEWLN